MKYRFLYGATVVALALAASVPGAWPQGGRNPAAAPVLRTTATARVTTVGDNLKPFVVARPQGGAYLVWARRVGERTAVYFARSTDGLRFTAPVRLSPESMDLDLGAESGPHVAVDGKGAIYVVWSAGSRAASRAGTAAGGAGHGGHGATHRHPPRPGNLTVYLVRSTDDGRTFSEPRQVNDGPDGPERRFPTVAVGTDGTVYVAWLDKRKETAQRPGYSRAYVARSGDGGRTFARNLDVTGRQESPICHCCKLALAAHPTEGVFVAFRNDRNDLRDMFLVHSKDGGEAFSEPAPIEDTQWIVPT